MNGNRNRTDVVLATDRLKRELPTRNETGGRKPGRKVGMFYFLWCGDCGNIDLRPLDITKLLSADPKAGYRPDAEEWGKYSVMHHWGEPMFGYYYSRDEWVMRRHVEMLTYADIDFLVFDTTNAVIYENTAKMMLRLLSEYRAMGFNTPTAMFYTNTASGKTVQQIYDAIYKPGYMPDSWFCEDGKPVIIANALECSPETREFFNIKMSQWPNEATKQGGWPWMDFERPQRVFENLKGEPEIINVSVAQHPQIHFGDSAMYGETANCGRSFHNGANDLSDRAWEHGYNFQEQWDRALETAPPYVFVTGWNEWIAGRWGGTESRPLSFVDCCDLEFSRDIEPMKGGYSDNYYLQLIANVRRYKGTDALPEAGEAAEYRNFPKGCHERNCEGYSTVYKDGSGRNAFTKLSVSQDRETLYFTAETLEDIVPYDFQSAWMELYLNVKNVSRPEKTLAPAWEGYNFIANTYQFSGRRTALSRCVQATSTKEPDTFKPCAILDYAFEGRKLTLTVPKAALGLDAGDRYQIRFKWMDSRRPVNSAEDFYTSGDAAPIGRLNYVYEG